MRFKKRKIIKNYCKYGNHIFRQKLDRGGPKMESNGGSALITDIKLNKKKSVIVCKGVGKAK